MRKWLFFLSLFSSVRDLAFRIFFTFFLFEKNPSRALGHYLFCYLVTFSFGCRAPVSCVLSPWHYTPPSDNEALLIWLSFGMFFFSSSYFGCCIFVINFITFSACFFYVALGIHPRAFLYVSQDFYYYVCSYIFIFI